MSAHNLQVDDGFAVDGWMHWLGGLVTNHPRFCISLGNLENRLFRDDLQAVPLDSPIYIGGLARSGSTILLEVLASHPETATHQYRDFPLVMAPLAWNHYLDRVPRRKRSAVERSHRDGILVTPESPEALEEMVWMTFFPHLHEPRHSNVLDGGTRHQAFEAFYRNHIRKLIYLRGGSRYLAKGNYAITRYEYLLKLFSDARFVIPLRSPERHIASLMRQHALFTDGQRRHPRSLTYLQRVGHYEFGLDRRPINTGDDDAVVAISEAWKRGEEVRGWAIYWRMLHKYLASRLAANPALRQAVKIVQFDELCRQPLTTLTDLFHHCRLDTSPVEQVAETIRLPTYYSLPFSDEERALIHRETAPAMVCFSGGGEVPLYDGVSAG